MNTKRRRLYIALSIVIILVASFSVLMYRRWNVPLDRVTWTYHWYLPLVSDRPVREDQVLSPDEILPGQILTFHDYGKELEIAIISKPYELGSQCKFDYVFLPVTWETYYINNISCSYVGLEPYVDEWHQFNYLSDTGKQGLGQLEIAFLNFWLTKYKVYSQQHLAVLHGEDCITEVKDGKTYLLCYWKEQLAP